MTRLTAATATSMMFIGFLSWVMATAQSEGGASPVISFAP